MGGLRGIFRLLRLFAHLVEGLYLSYTRLHGTQSHDLSTEQRQIIQDWLHRSAEIIGITIQVRGTPVPPPAFVIANHISWIDIISISSVLPVSFLAKAEIRRWPVIGTLAAKAGTLFIRRGEKNGAAAAVHLMRTHLEAQRSVASFPEAKTTDGNHVHPFHARLFAAAIDSDVMIQPVALTYPTQANKNDINPIVPYVKEGPGLINHAFRIMCAKRTIATVTFCEPIKINGKTRKELAQAARYSVAQVVNVAI